MGINIFVQSKGVIFWDRLHEPRGSIYEYFGYIDDKALYFFQEEIERLGFKFLGLVQEGDHLVLNPKQILAFERELVLLKKKGNSDPNVISIIQKAINMVKTDHDLYLKFASD